MKTKKENKIPNCICQNCEQEFYKPIAEIKRYPSHFCSKICFGKYLKKEQEELICQQCSKSFFKPSRYIKRSLNNFCSRSCAASYNNTHKNYGTRRSKLEIYLEEQIKENYPHLDLVCNQKTAIDSELDFYFPDLKFAIELNGITHYEPIYGEDKFEKIQSNDKRKIIACYEKGIELAIVDTSSCSYLSPNNKEKYKNIIFELIEKVRYRA